VTNPTYQVYVDWDCPNWAGVHDFTTAIDDISADVKHLRISRGKDRDSNTYPAATLEMVLENSSAKYYPTATAGDLVGKVRLWLPVKVEATYATVVYPLFYGYINRITAYPIKSRQDIYFYATDGTDLLAKTIVVQDMDDKTVQNDGLSVGQVLDAAGWVSATVACTMQNTPDNTITSAAHGLVNGNRVMFSGVSIPAELSTTVTYYVISALDDVFSVSLTDGGAPVDFASDGSGFYTYIPRRAIDLDGGDITNFPDTFEFTKPV
jgi:hypothetical protein